MPNLIRRLLAPKPRALERDVIDVLLADGRTDRSRAHAQSARQAPAPVGGRARRAPDHAAARKRGLGPALRRRASRLAGRAARPLCARRHARPASAARPRRCRCAARCCRCIGAKVASPGCSAMAMACRSRCPRAPAMPALRRALRDFYEGEARADLGRWLPRYLPTLPRPPRRVQFKVMSSQWGSLAPDGTVALDLALVLARPSAFEYVLVHELCHLIRADHSRAFWREVEARFPAVARRARLFPCRRPAAEGDAARAVAGASGARADATVARVDRLAGCDRRRGAAKKSPIAAATAAGSSMCRWWLPGITTSSPSRQQGGAFAAQRLRGNTPARDRRRSRAPGIRCARAGRAPAPSVMRTAVLMVRRGSLLQTVAAVDRRPGRARPAAARPVRSGGCRCRPASARAPRCRCRGTRAARLPASARRAATASRRRAAVWSSASASAPSASIATKRVDPLRRARPRGCCRSPRPSNGRAARSAPSPAHRRHRAPRARCRPASSPRPAAGARCAPWPGRSSATRSMPCRCAASGTKLAALSSQPCSASTRARAGAAAAQAGQAARTRRVERRIRCMAARRRRITMPPARVAPAPPARRHARAWR